MNILFLNYSLHGQGGSQMTSLSLAEAMQQRGHRVFYGAARGALTERLEASGIGYLELPFNRRWPQQLQNHSTANLHRLSRFLRREQIEVMHAFQRNPANLGAAARVFQPCLLFVSYLGPKVWVPPPGTSHVFSVTEELRDKAIRDAGQSSADITVLPNRIDFRRYGTPTGGSELAEKIGLPPDARVVCIVSTFDVAKLSSLRTFMQAVEQLAARWPRVHFVCCGEGPGGGELRTEAAEINRRVGRTALHLPGMLDSRTALDLAEIVVGIGRSAMEAMAAGRPVIVVGPSGYVQVADAAQYDRLYYSNCTGRGGPVADSPPAALAAAVTRLLDDPGSALRIGEASRVFALEHYDVGRGAEILEEHYRRTLEQGTGPNRLRCGLSLMGRLGRERLRTLGRRGRKVLVRTTG